MKPGRARSARRRRAVQSLTVTLTLAAVFFSGFGSVRYTVPIDLRAPGYPGQVRYTLGFAHGALIFDFKPRASTPMLGRLESSAAPARWTAWPELTPSADRGAGPIAIPMWLLALASAIASSQHLAKLSRGPANECPNCRYDLTGLSTDRCPGCDHTLVARR